MPCVDFDTQTPEPSVSHDSGRMGLTVSPSAEMGRPSPMWEEALVRNTLEQELVNWSLGPSLLPAGAVTLASVRLGSSQLHNGNGSTWLRDDPFVLRAGEETAEMEF